MLDLESWIRTKVRLRVRQAVFRYVLPGLLISGLGVVAALFLVWRDTEADKDQRCATSIESRNNFRTFAFGQHDQWDETLAIFPPTDDAVIAIQHINDERRAQTEANYPLLTEDNNPACD